MCQSRCRCPGACPFWKTDLVQIGEHPAVLGRLDHQEKPQKRRGVGSLYINITGGARKPLRLVRLQPAPRGPNRRSAVDFAAAGRAQMRAEAVPEIQAAGNGHKPEITRTQGGEP